MVNNDLYSMNVSTWNVDTVLLSSSFLLGMFTSNFYWLLLGMCQSSLLGMSA